MELIKQEICHELSDAKNMFKETICVDFSSSSIDIKCLFDSLKNSDNICSTVHHLDWYNHECKRTAPKIKDDFMTVLEQFFDYFLDDKESAIENENLLTERVRKTEKFGGLKFVNTDYFLFILRIKSVFIKFLTMNNLIMLGNALI